MNRLFYKSLVENTHYQFELIIIDNHSTDGSYEYFSDLAQVKVIRNDKNYSYPYCNNQGIEAAQYEYLAFLNNDIILTKDWDLKLIETMTLHQLSYVCPCGNERMGNEIETRNRMRRWKMISNPLRKFGVYQWNLQLMIQLMYSNLNGFAKQLYNQKKHQIKEGFCGFAILTTLTALKKIDGMDIRIQEADWDLYVKTKKRNIEIGDMKPIHIAMDTFVHHFGRLTAKTKFPDFEDRKNLLSFDDKWTQEERNKYLKDV